VGGRRGNGKLKHTTLSITAAQMGGKGKVGRREKRREKPEVGEGKKRKAKT